MWVYRWFFDAEIILNKYLELNSISSIPQLFVSKKIILNWVYLPKLWNGSKIIFNKILIIAKNMSYAKCLAKIL